MQIVILGSSSQRSEFAAQTASTADIVWVEDAAAFLSYKSGSVFIDLEFVNTPERIALLQRLLPQTVIVNSVIDTLADIDSRFVRINGWDGFFSSTVVEAACSTDNSKQETEEAFALLAKAVEWLPDDPGFVAPRVVSMIINEAFLALAEGVSTRDEINTAMKLGTAYPFGPFEWAEKIGVQNIVTLLQKLADKNDRYTPAELLVQEAARAI